MDRTEFLRRAEKWVGGKKQDGLHSTTRFFIKQDGKSHFLKEANEVLDGEGNKVLEVTIAPLACGHIVQNQEEAILLEERFYCRACVHRCPSCGHQIVPGTGERVEETWFHAKCATPHRRHVEFRLAKQEELLSAQVNTAYLHGKLTEAQIISAHVTNEINLRRMDLEERREESQERLLDAQIHGIFEGLELQERRHELDVSRLSLEASQASARLVLDQRRLNSELENAALQRSLAHEKAELEAAEKRTRLRSG